MEIDMEYYHIINDALRHRQGKIDELSDDVQGLIKDISVITHENEDLNASLKTYHDEESKAVNPTDLVSALNVVTQALKEDKGYYNSWQANIAVQFQDKVIDVDEREAVNVHEVSNQAAKSFLDLLIKESTDE